jgi:hypothetical protein
MGHRPPDGQFQEVAAGLSANCARDTQGAITCWGSGPLAITTAPAGLAHLGVGGAVACGLDSGGEIHCWGETQEWSFIPRGTFREVSVADYACALRSGGQIVCFGPPLLGPAYVNGDSLP